MIDYVAEEAMADWLDFRREYEPVEGVDYDDAYQPTAQEILDMDTSADPCDHAGWDCVCED